MILKITARTRLAIEPIQDFECREFHITPVLTYSWYESDNIKGGGLAFEWGSWAILFALAFKKHL